MQRYPENIAVTFDDFQKSGYKAAICSTNKNSYIGLWQSLSSAASMAIESEKISEGKVLWLLADACSMSLNTSSINEPFKPFMILDGKRSSIPGDFKEQDVLFFSQIADEIDDNLLKARIADLVWLLQRPRSHKYALLAIDSYRKISLDTETWISDGKQCWERAITLAKMLKAGAGERLKEMEITIISAFESAKPDDGFLALWLADLLAENHLGRDSSAEIATKLESLAQNFDIVGDLHRAREFFDSSAGWHHQSGSPNKVVEMNILAAETWVKEAIAQISSKQPSYIAAADLYEKAIHHYRKIERKYRNSYKVDERIAELHNEMNEAREKSLDEMTIISTPPIDIRNYVENAWNTIKGKQPLEALAAFTDIYQTEPVLEIRKRSEKILHEHPLQALFCATHISERGRVIAKNPGIGFGDTQSNEYESAIWAKMVQHYQRTVDLAVHASIIPALECLVLENRLTERDFIGLAKHSPIVPHDRSNLFGKALFAGYEMDFVTALHLLVPQIENMVRFHLKNAGVKTTTMDTNGIENENGLSTLMDLQETNKIFGNDLCFEIKALFCDSFGPNLRNQLAHGLLDEDMCQSTFSVYAWWLGLKLVFKTFWNTRQVSPASTNNRTDKPNG